MLLIAGWAYVADYYHADAAAISAVASAGDITVAQNGNTLAFVPAQEGDGLPSISGDEQLQLTAQLLTDFFD